MNAVFKAWKYYYYPELRTIIPPSPPPFFFNWDIQALINLSAKLKIQDEIWNTSINKMKTQNFISSSKYLINLYGFSFHLSMS